jgi:uncharacterized protein YhaN
VRIDRLDLLAFGGFTDHVLDLSAGPRRFHILFGPNESGKSTSLRAITGLLFGMESRTTDDFLHRKRDMRVGAKLVSENAQLDCIRRRGNKKTLLHPNGKDAADVTILEQMLAGVDRDTFLTQFGLSHSALVNGGRSITEGGGDLGEILFAAGAGVSRLNAIKQKLEEDWKQLFLPTGSKPRLNSHLSELKKLRAQLRDAQLLPSDYKRRQQALEEAEEEARRRDDEVRARQQRIGLWTSYQNAFPLLARRDALLDECKPLADIPLLDEDFVHRRREADLARQAAEDHIRQFQKRQNQLESQREKLSDDGAIGPLAATITGLYEHLGAIRNARRELPHLQNERQGLTDEITDILLDLQLPVDTEIESLRVPEAVRRRVDRLAEIHGPLCQRLRAAETQWQKLSDEAEEAESALARLEKPETCEELEAALRHVGNPQVLLQQLSDATDTLTRLEQRTEAKLRRLRGFDGSLEEAVALKPPLAASVRECADALETTIQERERLQEKQREQEEQLAQVQRDLDTVRNSAAVPSESELRDARMHRDGNLEALSQDLSDNRSSDALTRLPELRGQIRDADTTADRLRHEAERVAKRADAEASLAATTRKVEALKSQQQELLDACQKAKSRWLQLWRETDIDAGSPAEMKEWVDEHRQLIEIHEDYMIARSARQTAQESVERASAALSAALAAESKAVSLAGSAGGLVHDEASNDRQASLFADPSDVSNVPVSPDLASLCEAARQQLDQFRSAEQQYKQAVNDRQRIANAIPAAKRELRDLQKELEQWQADWRNVSGKIDVDPESTPEEVSRRLARIESLFDLARQRQKLEKKIEQIGSELESFEREAKETAALVAPDVAESDPLQAVERLMNQLQQHRQHETKRQSITEQLDQLENDMDAAKQAALLRTHELERLCQEADCDTIDALPATEAKSAKRAALERELRSVEEQLTLLAAGRDLKTFIEDVQQQDPAALEQRIASEQRELENEQAALNELRETLGTLRRDVRSMDGSDRAASLQQQIQDVLVKIRRDAEQYATLRVANVALHAAIERYREKNQGPVLKRAEELFSRLTDGVYGSLRAEFDEKERPILAGMRCDCSVPVQMMSDGTADALYLSLRLASLETHLQQRAPFPLIVDDILIQFDDRRAAAALSILAELSEKTQIIFFTHHQHLIELASETLDAGDFHVHTLDRQHGT